MLQHSSLSDLDTLSLVTITDFLEKKDFFKFLQTSSVFFRNSELIKNQLVQHFNFKYPIFKYFEDNFAYTASDWKILFITLKYKIKFFPEEIQTLLTNTPYPHLLVGFHLNDKLIEELKKNESPLFTNSADPQGLTFLHTILLSGNDAAIKIANEHPCYKPLLKKREIVLSLEYQARTFCIDVLGILSGNTQYIAEYIKNHDIPSFYFSSSGSQRFLDWVLLVAQYGSLENIQILFKTSNFLNTTVNSTYHSGSRFADLDMLFYCLSLNRSAEVIKYYWKEIIPFKEYVLSDNQAFARLLITHPTLLEYFLDESFMEYMMELNNRIINFNDGMMTIGTAGGASFSRDVDFITFMYSMLVMVGGSKILTGEVGQVIHKLFLDHWTNQDFVKGYCDVLNNINNSEIFSEKFKNHNAVQFGLRYHFLILFYCAADLNNFNLIKQLLDLPIFDNYLKNYLDIDEGEIVVEMFRGTFNPKVRNLLLEVLFKKLSKEQLKSLLAGEFSEIYHHIHPDFLKQIFDTYAQLSTDNFFKECEALQFPSDHTNNPVRNKILQYLLQDKKFEKVRRKMNKSEDNLTAIAYHLNPMTLLLPLYLKDTSLHAALYKEVNYENSIRNFSSSSHVEFLLQSDIQLENTQFLQYYAHHLAMYFGYHLSGYKIYHEYFEVIEEVVPTRFLTDIIQYKEYLPKSIFEKIKFSNEVIYHELTSEDVQVINCLFDHYNYDEIILDYFDQNKFSRLMLDYTIYYWLNQPIIDYQRFLHIYQTLLTKNNVVEYREAIQQLEFKIRKLMPIQLMDYQTQIQVAPLIDQVDKNSDEPPTKKVRM